jgi:hypothetical protein
MGLGAGFGAGAGGLGLGSTFGAGALGLEGAMAGLGAAGAAGAGAAMGAGAEGLGYGSGYGSSLSGGMGTNVPAGAGYGSVGGSFAPEAFSAGTYGAGAGGLEGAMAGLGSAGSVGSAAAGAAGLGGGGGGGSGTQGFNWGSLVGPAINGIGGLVGANAAKDAAAIQAQAAREAREMFKPWIDNGGWAIGQAGNMLGRNGAEAAKNAFAMDPGAQFRREQGEQGLTRAASAAGGLGSGKYLKDAMRFNSGLASQEFGNSVNRLLGVAGMGQTATGSGADYLTQGANASAAGKVGSANALTNAVGQGWSMYQNSQQQDQNNQFMNMLLRRGS